MITLFEIGANYKALEKLLDSEEIPDEVIRDTVEAIEGELEEKAYNVAKMVLHLKSQAESIQAAADKMAARAARVQKRSESLKAYLLFVMQSVNKDRFENAEMVIRRQNNPESVMVVNESAIPGKFWRTPPPPPKVIDKQMLKEALKNGEEIDGAFIEQGEHLRIVL